MRTPWPFMHLPLHALGAAPWVFKSYTKQPLIAPAVNVQGLPDGEAELLRLVEELDQVVALAPRVVRVVGCRHGV